jgi:large subunit ribosomal protein L6e
MPPTPPSPPTPSRHSSTPPTLPTTPSPSPTTGYPTEDVKQKVKRTFKPKTAKLRKSITPGTVLIMLQGRFAGKRVVFLKQLDSGLLLVTGPYSVNKVPLRRVDQTAVIATSTKLKITMPDLSACTDKEFSAKASKSARASTLKAAGKDKFFETAKETAVVSKERAALQASVDAAITKALAPDVTAYLKSKFKLSQGQRPHEMIF